jgi:hypothetical protein
MLAVDVDFGTDEGKQQVDTGEQTSTDISLCQEVSRLLDSEAALRTFCIPSMLEQSAIP